MIRRQNPRRGALAPYWTVGLGCVEDKIGVRC
jgi:hypothetical protein